MRRCTVQFGGALDRARLKGVGTPRHEQQASGWERARDRFDQLLGRAWVPDEVTLEVRQRQFSLVDGTEEMLERNRMSLEGLHAVRWWTIGYLFGEPLTICCESRRTALGVRARVPRLAHPAQEHRFVREVSRPTGTLWHSASALPPRWARILMPIRREGDHSHSRQLSPGQDPAPRGS